MTNAYVGNPAQVIETAQIESKQVRPLTLVKPLPVEMFEAHSETVSMGGERFFVQSSLDAPFEVCECDSLAAAEKMAKTLTAFSEIKDLVKSIETGNSPHPEWVLSLIKSCVAMAGKNE